MVVAFIISLTAKAKLFAEANNTRALLCLCKTLNYLAAEFFLISMP